MSLTVSILATGSEILDGRVVDTNSNFVAQILSERGIPLKRILTVDDNLPELLAGLEILHEVSDVIITIGGLGPTADDLTRDMSAAYAGVQLVEYPEARQHLIDFYAVRKRTLDPSNLRQAMLPQGSEMIPNPCGTAPGFIVTRKGAEKGTKIVCSLSGVPREFKAMFNDTVLPLLLARSSGSKEVIRAGFRLFGLPESVVGKEVVALGFPESIGVSYRASFPEVHLVVKGVEPSEVAACADKIRNSPSLSPFIFTEDVNQSMSAIVSSLVRERKGSIAAAESCTAGMFSAALAALPGSSDILKGGVVAYSNEVKVNQLGVPAELIAQDGAVSASVAKAMAGGCRERLGATFGIGITGIAGPGGGSPEKPVGTFYVAVATEDSVQVKGCLFVNERSYVQRYAVHAALELLRRTLVGNPAGAPFPSEIVKQ